MQSQAKNSKPETGNSQLTPDALSEHLLSTPNFSSQSLASHFHCTPGDLTALLHHPDFLTRNHLDTQLAFLQSRLLARKYLSHALGKTVTLMTESEKPEVARRAASALIQIAGLPIRTAPQPAPLPFPQPPAPSSEDPKSDVDDLYPDNQELLAACAFVLAMKRCTGVDMASIPDDLRFPLAEVIRTFLKQNNIPCGWGMMAPPDDEPELRNADIPVGKS